MKRYVEGVGRGGQCIVHLHMADAGLKDDQGQLSLRPAVVRTDRQPILKLPPDIMEGGMPAPMGEGGLNVQKRRVLRTNALQDTGKGELPAPPRS